MMIGQHIMLTCEYILYSKPLIHLTLFPSFADRDMFARYAGIGVGHDVQYNLQSSNISCLAMQQEPLIAVDEQDLSDGNEDMGEADEGHIGEVPRSEEEADDDDNSDEEEEGGGDSDEEDDNDDDNDDGIGDDDDDDDQGCCDCGFKF